MNPLMQVPFVDLSRQYKALKKEINEVFSQISSRGAYILSDEVREFESAFARYCESKFSVGVANATDALTLVLKALKVGAGDEVITVPNSFIATAGSIIACGAKPVFVDVGSDYNMLASALPKAITSKTRAIVPVHLTGRPADMDPILAMAAKYGLPVIEDAAQAVGAKYKGARVGGIGRAACFSLHPLKNLHVQGDGGIITTNDEALYENLLRLRNHGLINRDESVMWGYNSRLDSVQAGIALLKLKYIDDWNGRHRQIAQRYRSALEGLCALPAPDTDTESVYHNFVFRTPNRSQLQAYLLKMGVETKIHYPIAIHLQKAAKELGYKEGDFPEAEAQAREIVSLPIYPELQDNEVEYVISSLISFFRGR